MLYIVESSTCQNKIVLRMIPNCAIVALAIGLHNRCSRIFSDSRTSSGTGNDDLRLGTDLCVLNRLIVDSFSTVGIANVSFQVADHVF